MRIILCYSYHDFWKWNGGQQTKIRPQLYTAAGLGSDWRPHRRVASWSQTVTTLLLLIFFYWYATLSFRAGWSWKKCEKRLHPIAVSLYLLSLLTHTVERSCTHTHACTCPCTDRLTHQPLLPSRTCAVHKQHMIYGPACNKNMIYDFCNCFRDFAWMLLTTHQENSLEDENKLGLLGLQRDLI